tara:strand:+ start:36 stop:1016 length:981 start_codon:yes stop_codon:yes gene_type:complete
LLRNSQLVLPAIYCNYKRKNILKFLPADLVDYMKEITSLNKNRNLQITNQISELNVLLKQNGINPIFIKGSCNLIQGLYEDPAERMIGDIDFLVSEKDYDLSVKILLDNNYKPVSNIDYNIPFRHYPRLFHKNYLAAVEIHKDMILEKYASEFNHTAIKNGIIQKNGFSVLSYDDQKALSIFSNQINDKGFEYKTIGLKNTYDFLLLNSKKPGIEFALRYNKLKKIIMCFLASVNYMVGDLALDIDNNQKVKWHLKIFKSFLHDPKKRKYYSKIVRIKFILVYRLKIILKSFIDKNYRTWLFKRISDKRWQRKKLVQLRLKKPINN